MTEQKWIPCAKRLPEIDQEVLAQMTWGDMSVSWRFEGDLWFTQSGEANAKTEDIVAWMPLPEPYIADEVTE